MYRVGSAIEHTPENFRGHNQARAFRINGQITGNKTHVVELLLEVSVLLIGQGFDGGGIYRSCHVFLGHGNRILGHDGFARRGVRCDKYTLSPLETHHGLLLEGIEFKGKLHS